MEETTPDREKQGHCRCKEGTNCEGIRADHKTEDAIAECHGERDASDASNNACDLRSQPHWSPKEKKSNGKTDKNNAAGQTKLHERHD